MHRIERITEQLREATSGTKPRGRARTRDHVVAHIDINPLLTNVTRPGERCEIPRVRPRPRLARTHVGTGRTRAES